MDEIRAVLFDVGGPINAEFEHERLIDADIVAASALLTTTMPEQRRLAEAIAASDIARKPKLLVGGAPTSPRWAASFGAAHAENALRAVAAAEALLA